ncbi:MAG: DUF697 domain-containing protein [Candidatus Electrothrix sp. AW2]|nr:DUF697 domain-containing protein [Candidatus Electrothrix sp. AX1]MCI5133971.1 DUF697 domain-containing protein [Candidatus Electrothrix gigas]MCI5179793.1 DUF697 domain-containing protein [Candidatus Electrothrix gigas]MCI5181406.1 DUF697 domain-containing protein [Candidatus Electrothrix gigas]
MQENNTEQQSIQQEYDEESVDSLEKIADKMIRQHVYMSLGVGLFPLPFIDFIGVSGIQLNLMRKLSELYDVPFSKDMVKNIIGALIGGAFPASAGSRILASFSKAVPGVGQTLGALGSATVSGASTYAVGKVFARHFAEGGTFLSFDPEKAKAFYEEMFKEGQEVAADIKKEKNKEDNAEGAEEVKRWR